MENPNTTGTKSNNQIDVAKKEKKKVRLERREPSAKKNCHPKGIPKNLNPNNKPVPSSINKNPTI